MSGTIRCLQGMQEKGGIGSSFILSMLIIPLVVCYVCLFIQLIWETKSVVESVSICSIFNLNVFSRSIFAKSPIKYISTKNVSDFPKF